MVFSILLVAHRLRTVIDYDRLIVLDKGEVRVTEDMKGSCLRLHLPDC